MDLTKLGHSRSRLSLRVKESENSMPLYSRMSILPTEFNTNFEEEGRKDEYMLELIKNIHNQDSMISNLSTTCFNRSRKTITYGATTSSFIDQKYVLQIIIQNTANQLLVILGKYCLGKSKLHYYKTPEERFMKKEEYALEEDIPLKTKDQKMLKIQQLIKDKIDEVIMFLHSILKETSEEMRNERTYTTLVTALDNIYKTKSDNFTILNMKAEELCKQLFHDIKRIDKESDRLVEMNRGMQIGFISVKDRLFFLNMKQKNYVDKWETSRQWLLKYLRNKECNNIIKYIRDMEDKVLKEGEVTLQVSTFLELDTMELEHKRDEYPEKLEKECDMRNRVIWQLKEELEQMAIRKKELIAELAKRTIEINDWKIYKAKKEAEEAELRRIAEEEELARIKEEERIAEELAAEEALLATFTSIEREVYLKNKKEEERLAAKKIKIAAKKAKAAAKKAAKAERKERRKA